ncbi:hypothetical protein Tco_0210531 [Tanacetum coccineum]
MSYPHPKRNFVPKAVLMKTRMRQLMLLSQGLHYNCCQEGIGLMLLKHQHVGLDAKEQSPVMDWVPIKDDWRSLPNREDMKNAHINEDHFCSDGMQQA